MTALSVPVHELLRSPGSRREFEILADIEDVRAVDAALAPEPVLLELAMDGLPDGVVASGAVTFVWTGSCRRCLEPVEGSRTVRFQEVFEVGADPDGETLPLPDDVLDLEPLVRELVITALPLAPLCREDCVGPDPDRFPTRTEEDVEAEKAAAPDPRWAGLGDLSFE